MEDKKKLRRLRSVILSIVFDEGKKIRKMGEKKNILIKMNFKYIRDGLISIIIILYCFIKKVNS